LAKKFNFFGEVELLQESETRFLSPRGKFGRVAGIKKTGPAFNPQDFRFWIKIYVAGWEGDHWGIGIGGLSVKARGKGTDEYRAK
jgi:hypothetical protein